MAGAVFCTAFCLPFVMTSVIIQPRHAAADFRATLEHTGRAASDKAGNTTQGDAQASSNSTKQLDIVIATYGDRMQRSAHTWEQLLALPKVTALLPYVTIYNQDSSGKSSGWLEHQTSAMLHNGRVIYLDNKGRESRVHMYHIVNNWHNLSRYTWFSQDIPSDHVEDRVETLFMPGRTAMLGVGPSWPVACDETVYWTERVPIGTSTHLFEMVHEMVKGTPCEDGIWAAYKGEFIVSDKRIHENDLTLYQHLLELLEAPPGHPIHNRHDRKVYKDPSHPWFAHVMERAWSVLFNCTDMSMQKGCRECESKGWRGCEPDSCQCTEP